MQRSTPLPIDALEKWKLFSTLYPDAYVARYYYALLAWKDTNQYDSAITELSKALSEHNPALGDTYYFLGVLELATERSRPRPSLIFKQGLRPCMDLAWD